MVLRLFAVSVALGACAVPLVAQPGEREDPHLRNDCRLAAQVIQTGNPAPRREWAMEALRRCNESGPVVLAELWRTGAYSQPKALDQLFNVTRDFNDRRVVDAAADVARNNGAPETTRIYALALLYSYAVPGLYIDIEDLLDPGEAPPGMSGFSHDTRAAETRAKLGDLRPEVVRLLESLISNDPDGRIGVAAATVLRRVRASSRQLGTP